MICNLRAYLELGSYQYDADSRQNSIKKTLLHWLTPVYYPQMCYGVVSVIRMCKNHPTATAHTLISLAPNPLSIEQRSYLKSYISQIGGKRCSNRVPLLESKFPRGM